MLTYQDFLKDPDKPGFIRKLINQHRSSREMSIALDADCYDRQENSTIKNYERVYYDFLGQAKPDPTASNSKLCSAYFPRLNTQRNTYSLGNGVTFAEDKSGRLKEKLGKKFDTRLKDAGYYALIHGISFLFWADELYFFKLTEFAPLWDEETGQLRAGVRFWQIDSTKPFFAVLYEEDGFTKYRSDAASGDFAETDPKRSYRITTRKAPADPVAEVIATGNYGSLPIVPLWGSRLHQSTLIGMKAKIDAQDLVKSGFANDMEDCAEIYWLIANANGMSDRDMMRFRDRLKFNHIAKAQEGDVKPYKAEIPTAARESFLTQNHKDIYQDFGGLDVHTVSANSTNDHLDAAYQPMDENADDFEYQIIEAVQGILALLGEEDTPIFKRNRIVNQREQTEMVLQAANYLDDETVLNKLSWITPDEVALILQKRDAEDAQRMKVDMRDQSDDEETEEGDQ